MPEFTTSHVRLKADLKLPVNVMVTAAVAKVLSANKQTETALFERNRVNYRIFRLTKPEMEMPDVVIDFLNKDRRYQDYIEEVIADDAEVDDDPEGDGDPEVDDDPEGDGDAEVSGDPEVITDDPEVDGDPEVDDSIFDLWGRAEIENANLNGDEGLKAYASYHEIDLGDNRLVDDVRAAILDWYTVNYG